MGQYQTEYLIKKNGSIVSISFRIRNINLKRYFTDFYDKETMDLSYISKLVDRAMEQCKSNYPITQIKVERDITIDMEICDANDLSAFIDAFLEELESYYEENEVHITRMFGSFIYLKRISGKLKAVKATPIPIQYCPLMKKLLLEVGGKMASELLLSLDQPNKEIQTIKMCELINKTVIDGGYFNTARPLNSCETNVLFGASETMSSAFKKGLIDAAVIVSNNLGTIITTNNSNTQGAVKRMTGLFLTSPSKELMKTAEEAGIIPVFPHTATIDQLEGVKYAIALGYKKIAVSIAWMDNNAINEIKALETEDVSIYIFALCSTGIDPDTAIQMQKADVVWSCASKAIKDYIEPNAIAQVGIKIPVHIMTDMGWKLVKNHLSEMSSVNEYENDSFNQVSLSKGNEKPIIMHSNSGFEVIKKSELRKCSDCPYPCI